MSNTILTAADITNALLEVLEANLKFAAGHSREMDAMFADPYRPTLDEIELVSILKVARAHCVNQLKARKRAA